MMGVKRATMGNDWGGRSADNPKGAPRVTKAAVLALAEKHGFEMRRGVGWTVWELRPRGAKTWRTGYTTNYLMAAALPFYAAHEIMTWDSRE